MNILKFLLISWLVTTPIAIAKIYSIYPIWHPWMCQCIFDYPLLYEYCYFPWGAATFIPITSMCLIAFNNLIILDLQISKLSGGAFRSLFLIVHMTFMGKFPLIPYFKKSPFPLFFSHFSLSLIILPLFSLSLIHCTTPYK